MKRIMKVLSLAVALTVASTPLLLLRTAASASCTDDDFICLCDESSCSDPGNCKDQHDGSCGVAVGEKKCECFISLPT